MSVLEDVVLPRLELTRRTGAGWSARCPAHDDRMPSLSVSVGKEHPVVFHCQAGCDRELILQALGLTWSDISRPREKEQSEWTPRGPAVHVYDYVDEAGALLFQVCRTADKHFTQRRPDRSTKSGWSWKLGDTRRVPYRLPKVIAAVAAGEVINVVEGEKDVQTLEGLGLVATCNPGGAGKWKDEYSIHFAEADVRIIADRDNVGQVHARAVATSLEGIAARIRIVEAAEGKDATDHFAAGHKVADLVEIWRSDEPAKLDLAPDLWEFIGTEDAPYDWIVPGLLERGDRLVWTGFEGLGKSMWTRQLAVCVAAGLDPFTFEYIEPRTVLMIDCENSERQSRRKFRPLAHQSDRVARRVPDGALRLIHRPEGLDLLRAEDRSWLMERVTAHQPDLLIIGPFYRLHAGNLNDELPARKVVEILDLARAKADCAVVVEAHAGHGEHGHNRSVRPVGSSLLLRWPEFGYGITPNPMVDPRPDGRCRDVLIKSWRGDRDDRAWPSRMIWGEGWPWQAWVL